jgi:hypothetical protein
MMRVCADVVHVQVGQQHGVNIVGSQPVTLQRREDLGLAVGGAEVHQQDSAVVLH